MISSPFSLVRSLALTPAMVAVGLLPLQQQDCDDGGGSGDGPSAEELLALTQDCVPLAGVAPFAENDGDPATIPMCGLNGAIWFKADMDIDCDGGSGYECHTDPYYQESTSCVDSGGDYLDASTLPFIVLPLDGNGWNDGNYGIKCGTVAAVIFGDQVEYGVFGDRGPEGVIGEASYAMADLFGIDPNPIYGGAEGGVTYIAFTNNAVVTPIESHEAAETLGIQEAEALLADN